VKRVNQDATALLAHQVYQVCEVRQAHRDLAPVRPTWEMVWQVLLVCLALQDFQAHLLDSLR
jgi:hypothetical protein